MKDAVDANTMDFNDLWYGGSRFDIDCCLFCHPQDVPDEKGPVCPEKSVSDSPALCWGPQF